jgi:receptor protein-tyrosine kinase
MSSMAKVMEKIWGNGEAGAPDDASGDAPPQDGAAPAMGADAVATEAQSGFVPDGAAPASGGADAASVLATFDERTVEWDPQRVDPVVVAFHDRYSAHCEQYRSVRARLLTMNAQRTPQVIAVTSSIPEEGKSVSTINLSLVMAEGGEHRILIVDADFRRTSIARMLGVPSEPGFAEVLRGDVSLADALQPTPYPNLKVLAAGHVKDKAYGDLLGGPSTAAALEQFREAFDYTFTDTPPITTVSDVCLLAPHCNGAIMVIEMRRTPEPTVQQAVRTLQANNVKVLGCLLSRYRDRGTGYYEHYYSSYYNR